MPSKKSQLGGKTRNLAERVASDPFDQTDEPETPTDAPPRLLIVCSDRLTRDRLAARLDDTGAICTYTGSTSVAEDLLSRTRHDVALIHASGTEQDAPDLVRQWRESHPALACVILRDHPGIPETLDAIRCGAADVLSPDASREQTGMCIDAAVQRARVEQAREDRVRRLQRACRRLNLVRHEITKQLGSLCNDLVEAFRDLSDQVAYISDIKEFEGIVRQELEIESLLRIVLEFILAKVGPTNGAIFLPAAGGEFSLGAYVNYDHPRETAEMALDQLATVLPQRFEHDPSVLVCNTDHECQALLAEHTHWLPDTEIVTLGCHHDGECLAVLSLFRDRHSPFTEGAVGLLTALAPAFARQLAQVIYVHHRHLPKEQWGTFGEPEDDIDGLDLAA